jgi:hypothetical protein
MKLLKTILHESAEVVACLGICFFELCIVTPYMIVKEYILDRKKDE